MATLPRIGTATPSAITTGLRQVAGARNVATPDGGAVRTADGLDPTFADGPGFFFRPAEEDETGPRHDRPAPPTLFGRFSATTSEVTAALNEQRARDTEREEGSRGPSSGAATGLAAQASGLYRHTAAYLAEPQGRGGALNFIS